GEPARARAGLGRHGRGLPDARRGRLRSGGASGAEVPGAGWLRRTRDHPLARAGARPLRRGLRFRLQRARARLRPPAPRGRAGRPVPGRGPGRPGAAEGLRPLSPEFRSFPWAISTAEAARIAGIEPRDVLRFDGNTMPGPPASARPETLAAALRSIQSYAHGGHPELLRAIADYAGGGPEHVGLGAGADDRIMLCGRSFAGPGDRVAIADEPTYPSYRIAAWVAGAEVSDESPMLTFCCRPHNPTGALVDLPAARPLVVDEAYFEFCRDSAASLIDDGVVVIRTFSKAFGLASARIGYAL